MKGRKPRESAPTACAKPCLRRGSRFRGVVEHVGVPRQLVRNLACAGVQGLEV